MVPAVVPNIVSKYPTTTAIIVLLRNADNKKAHETRLNPHPINVRNKISGLQ